jgi:hypothetical protein
LTTWTPAALSAERRRISGQCWRIVEAQHRVSTLKLVDTLAEQQRLEELLDESKPPVPVECRRLHYLLATPFRYGAPYPRGSRFRRAGLSPGVFYASRAVTTAIAETAFHRLLFFADAPDTPWPQNAGEYTAFSVRFRTATGLDLDAAPLAHDRSAWTHPTEYGPCQRLADAAREAEVGVLRYRSARDTNGAGGVNLALLTCRAFALPGPLERQTWRMFMGPSGVRALCIFPERRIEFDRDAFSRDPRIAALHWNRASR